MRLRIRRRCLCLPPCRDRLEKDELLEEEEEEDDYDFDDDATRTHDESLLVMK